MIEIRRFILLFGYFYVSALFAESNGMKDYQVVVLEECSIPIDKRFELIEKYSQYEYNFIAKIIKPVPDSNQTYTDMKFLRIKKIDKSKKIFEMLKKDGYKQIYDKRFLDYRVLRKKPDYSLDESFLYVISNGKTYISLTKSNDEEAIRIIEYCEKTKKR